MLKFSIIIPICNTSAYLSECIDSIINQKYTNIEIICVNDGSTDNSLEILEKYSKQDNRIIIINQHNQGAGAARNNGINIVTGDYICFVDSDDIIEDCYIEKLYNCIKQNNYDLVVASDYEWYQRPLESLGLLPTCATVVKNDFLVKYPDVRFPIGIRPAEDGIFSHKIITLTDNIGVCKEAKYIYRQRQDSSEHTITSSLIEDQIPKWLNIIEEHYNRHNLWGNNAHLLTFLMAEPYYRLKSLQYTCTQEKQLVDKILNFVHKYKLNENFDAKFYNADFVNFINLKNYNQYQKQKNKKINKFFQVLFSIKNSENKTHKVITLLGLKIKIKRMQNV